MFRKLRIDLSEQLILDEISDKCRVMFLLKLEYYD